MTCLIIYFIVFIAVESDRKSTPTSYSKTKLKFYKIFIVS